MIKQTARLILCLAAAVLASCDLVGTATTHNTFVVLVSNCPSDQLSDNCRLRPLEKLDITVSPSAQRVAWKKTGLDGVTADYVTGTKCAVLGSRDFHCDELSEDGDKISPNQALDNWPELLFRGVVIDDHLFSWCLWYVSTGNSPATASKGAVDLLSHTVASIVVLALLAFVAFYCWVWLQVKLEATVKGRDEGKRRKKLGY